MTRLLAAVALAALLPGASGSAAPSGAPFGGSAPHVTQTVLGNGLRVVVVENHAVPLANVAMWYRFGSANDPPGHYGLAHALEHMMFRGTRALSGAGLDLVHARLGIEANAETGYESTHYYQTLPVDELAIALHVEADRMHGLVLRPRDWELERGAILAELSKNESAAAGALESAVRAAAYRGTPFAHDQVGSERDLARTTTADLRRAYEAAYQPDNATLVVTGDVSPDAVVPMARTYFGALHGHAHVVRSRATAPVARGFSVQLGPFAERIIDVALAAHGEGAADSAAEEVAAELLGPEHAPLRTLVDDGPCWSYSVVDDRTIDRGLYHVVCHVSVFVKTRDAVYLIRRALRRLATHPPTTLDIGYARRADLANAAFGRDSLKDEADYFGGNIALLHADPRHGEADTARVADAAVAAVLRRWAVPVGVGVALAQDRTAPRESGTAPQRRDRLEQVAPASEAGAVVEPSWTRFAARGVRAAEAPVVDTFALPNGVRVFVEPRRGNGTVYVRAGLDASERASRVTERAPGFARIAEQHAITVDDEPDVGMRGFAREAPTMLRLVARQWRMSTLSRAIKPRPEHAWIAVMGDVDPLAVRARVAELFGGWHVAAPPQPSASPRASERRTRLLLRSMVLRTGTSDVRAVMMQRAPERDDPDRPAMTLVDEIVGGGGGGLDSRLATGVRRQRGLAYLIGSYYDADDGRFFVLFDAPRRRFRAARAAVRAVLSGLRTHPVTSEELDRARHKLLAEALRDESDPSGILDRLSAAARERRPPDDLASLAARYDAVTLADVRRVARTRVTPDKMIEFDGGGVP